VLRTVSIIIRPNELDIRFNFVSDMAAHRDSEHQVLSHEENGCKAIELAVVRDVLVEHIKA